MIHVGTEPSPFHQGVSVVLLPDNWDDYGFRTQFILHVRVVGGQTTAVGAVKILAKAYPDDYPKATQPLLERAFSQLSPAEFCSLGQSSNFYANLRALETQRGAPPGTARQILQALADINFLPPDAKRWWETESSGFETSLLRFNDAFIAKREAVALVEGRSASEDVIHSIPLSEVRADIEIGPRHVEFSFDGSRTVPGRVNVVIGRNGSGKSSLLAGLARTLTSEVTHRKEGYVPRFSRVVYVSFNAFQSVGRGVEHWERSSLRFIGYKPGDAERLRVLWAAARSATDDAAWASRLLEILPNAATALKSLPYETHDLATLADLKHDPAWVEFTKNAFDDDRVGAILIAGGDQLAELSPGQRVLAALYAGLFTHLDRRALVLIDEPENHLHPSMLASFMRHMNDLLDDRHAFAIVVTHSPIVLQETPSRCVWVMSRDGDLSTLAHPAWETFGDSVDSITQFLFETDFSKSHWKRVLQELFEQGLSTIQAQSEIGERELPMLARALYEHMRLKAGRT